ncbi:hypothetical protein PQU92_11385 [Asticcacaulis sp. BYS171W]|uniref:TonB C-terminal domain-containing protein n=1 Tax=Asticcacaulis aquaticus TaxID=2984212 RepID=A0ABT5HUX7_9CAUL|nr:hypothetical protein [Asticcacaulis aquaticus]MDC7683882.1 hypothetical protein [Asticcacaulis aquaticus]
MWVLWLMVAVLTGVAGTVAAQDETSTSRPQPTMKKAPPADAMLKLYPKAAINAKIGGEVIITCGWTANGRLKDCRALKEEPEGYGFADVTIRGFEAYTELQGMTGDSGPGEEKKFRYRWTIE